MCDFCDPATEKEARERARSFANELRVLAVLYDALAQKEGLVHTADSARICLRAKTAIRKLAEHWL